MKTVLICLLFGLALSYNAQLALLYAQNYCNKYNPKYNDYHKMDSNKEAFNFISQSLKEGGVDFEGCEGLDDKGMIKKNSDLKKCLTLKGWKKTNKISKGYPMFLRYGSFPMIITDVQRSGIIFCSHNYDRCDGRVSFNSVDIYSPS